MVLRAPIVNKIVPLKLYYRKILNRVIVILILRININATTRTIIQYDKKNNWHTGNIIYKLPINFLAGIIYRSRKFQA